MKLLSIYLIAFSLTFVSVRADAQARRGAPRAGGAAGQAVPRTAPPRTGDGRAVVPRAVAPYRSYYYPYRYPYALSRGFYDSYPYGYYGYPYGYGYYGYRYGYGYPAGAGGFGGYVAVGSGAAYGAVRIQGAPRDAQVYADGYYVGIVDDFDGIFQHLNLTPGAHRIEIRAPGAPPAAFDVRVEPGQTITYHAN